MHRLPRRRDRSPSITVRALVLALDATYSQPIDWKCRDCDFVLKASNAREATMPAAGHYIRTGHAKYDQVSPSTSTVTH